jgi:hypothetical protein
MSIATLSCRFFAHEHKNDSSQKHSESSTGDGTARARGESAAVRNAYVPGRSAATPAPVVCKRKSACGLLMMPTTASILDGKNSNPIAEMAMKKVVNVIKFLNMKRLNFETHFISAPLSKAPAE